MQSRPLNESERDIFKRCWNSDLFDCPDDHITITLTEEGIVKIHDSFLASSQGGHATCVHKFSNGVGNGYNLLNEQQILNFIRSCHAIRHSNLSLNPKDSKMLEQAQNNGVQIREVWLESYQAGDEDPNGLNEEIEWGITASYLNHGGMPRTHTWYIGSTQTEYEELQVIMNSQREIAQINRIGLISDPLTEHVLASFDKDHVKKFIAWLRENPKRTILNNENRLVGIFIWSQKTVPEEFRDIMGNIRGIMIQSGQIRSIIRLSPEINWENWNLHITNFSYPESIYHSLIGKSVKILTDIPIFESDMTIRNIEKSSSGLVSIIRIHNPNPIMRSI